MLTTKIIFDLFLGIRYSANEIICKYVLTIVAGGITDLFGMLSRRILPTIKNKIKFKSSDLTQWFLYTCATALLGVFMCLFHILMALVWDSVEIRIFMIVFSLVFSVVAGTLLYLFAKLWKKIKKKDEWLKL
jgi:hypothetical protein